MIRQSHTPLQFLHPTSKDESMRWWVSLPYAGILLPSTPAASKLSHYGSSGVEKADRASMRESKGFIAFQVQFAQ